MSKKIEEITDKIEANKEVLSTMPKNNIKNMDIYPPNSFVFLYLVVLFLKILKIHLPFYKSLLILLFLHH